MTMSDRIHTVTYSGQYPEHNLKWCTVNNAPTQQDHVRQNAYKRSSRHWIFVSVDFDKFSDTKKQQPKIVLILIIYTMYILKFIRWDWLLCSYDILSCREMTSFLTDAIFCVTQIKMHNFLSWLTEDLHNFLTTRWAIFLMILCLWTRYTIFIHQNRQFSWQFYVSKRDTQFSYTKTGNFPGDFMSLTLM